MSTNDYSKFASVINKNIVRCRLEKGCGGSVVVSETIKPFKNKRNAKKKIIFNKLENQPSESYTTKTN